VRVRGDADTGLTNSGRVKGDFDALPEDFKKLIDVDGSNPDLPLKLDGDVIRLREPVRVEFDTPALRDNPVEARRQLDLQQHGLNDLNARHWLGNLNAYTPGTKRVDPPFHTAVRDALMELRVQQLKRLGFDDAAAKAAANLEYDGKALLHSPDRIAGGDAFGYTGMGDSRINSALGAGWKTRREGLSDSVTRILEDIPPEMWPNIRLNIELVGPRP
jgi:hypothetical protein